MNNNTALRNRIHSLAALVGLALLACSATGTAYGQIYAAMNNNSSVVSFNAAGVGTTFASYPDVNSPYGLTIDSAGNIYVARLITGSFGAISKITPSGVAANFATTSLGPRGLALDSFGSLYVTIQNNTIEKYTSGGVGSVFVSSGLSNPGAVVIDASDNLYVADYNSRSIKKITSGGLVSTFTATGDVYVGGLALDSAGNLYAAFQQGPGGGNIIQKYTPAAVSSVFANTYLNLPTGLVFDSSGNLYVGNAGDATISKFTSSGIGSLFASTGGLQAYALAVAPIPEPATCALLLGLATLGFVARRRQAC